MSTLQLFLLIFLILQDYESSTSSESPTSSTQNPKCLIECPTGYLIGKTSCFQLLPPTPSLNSYQSALSTCMSVPRQTLASLEKFREDVALIQSSASEKNVNWIYSNGIGSRKERFEKRADVYSIWDQGLVSAPIVTTVGISEKFMNISTLCILPKFCQSPICDVEQFLLTYDYNLRFSSSSTKSLSPRQSAFLTCIPKKQEFEITCGTLGNIYPEPSMIDCTQTSFEETLGDVLLQGGGIVSSCSQGFPRGVQSCEPVNTPDGERFQLTCKPRWTMSTCWYTPDTCTPNYCGEHGRCVSVVGESRCECLHGWSGDNCQWNLREKFSKVWTFPVFTGVILALGGFVVRFVKRAVAIERMEMENDEDDPQSTHQTLRSYCMFVAGILVLFSSNPSLTNINPTACRFNFIAVHFSFVYAMVQWLLEAWNVNQVLRCVHLNEWERDWNGLRSWGVRIAPRMGVSVVMVSVALLVTFHAGWNQLAQPWTCVGVIREETMTVWIPIFSIVICIFLLAGAVCESSLLIKFRRPLLGYRLDLRIERDLGHVEGRRVEKCRRNEILCMTGLTLLIVLWLLTIYSADYKDDVVIGSLTVLMSLIYSLFSFYQEVETCPEDRAMWITILQRYLPTRFAPSYNPESMWTTEEVREMYSMPKALRDQKYRDYVSKNQYLHLHHRWDLELNKVLAADNQMTIDEALVRVFCEEMNRLMENNGTIRQRIYVQDAYKDFLNSIPDIDPRTEKGRVQARLELVTLAADAPIGVKLAKFFIVPGFDIFEPDTSEDVDGGNLNPDERQHRRLLNERIRMEEYRIMREEAHAQAVFINSSIHFRYFGNEIVR
ncbi:hypothetical protein GCK72_004549 [Caenorhabditis remanei]|uniref:EGF-like domain-containing protein n=1 Tax=Caenorhabditis remanei TaxID=31234 RepID=A0A6A5H9X2_CAERE|nr:hypothetical protein GCK72_004549 [Caenorhabditis remanei]KAF1764600.1 hypothetical protein GCK72_004549 [Caenorhabditis remanei]